MACHTEAQPWKNLFYSRLYSALKSYITHSGPEVKRNGKKLAPKTTVSDRRFKFRQPSIRKSEKRTLPQGKNIMQPGHCRYRGIFLSVKMKKLADKPGFVSPQAGRQSFI